MSTGIHALAAATEILEHAKEEQEHANIAAERITQLGDESDFNPEILAKRTHSQYVAGTLLPGMVRDYLIAERIAADSYRQNIQYLGDLDLTTRVAMEQSMGQAEGHADDMKKLLDTLSNNELAAEHA